MLLYPRFIVQTLHLPVCLLLSLDLIEYGFDLHRGALVVMYGRVLSPLRDVATALPIIRLLRHVVRLSPLHQLILRQWNQRCSIFEGRIILLYN
jgi:hypothetical protein